MNRKKREQLILEAAVRVFSHQGYSKTSVSEIIQEAGVARGTFYLYFKSKANIFSALLDNFLQDILRSTVKITTTIAAGEGTSQLQLRLIATDLIATITQNRLLAKMVFVDRSVLTREFLDRIQVFNGKLVEVVKNHLVSQIKAGHSRSCPTEVVARCLIGSIKELTVDWLINGSTDLETTIAGVMDFAKFGLEAPTSDAARHPAEEMATDVLHAHLNNLH